MSGNDEIKVPKLESSSLLSLDYVVTDVFTDVQLEGNPVAVILDGSTLSTEQMQQIAHWTNLSETTFVVPACSDNADYAVRIFTPSSELPFAGHPSLGTAHALVEKGHVDGSKGFLIQECPRGLIRIEITQESGPRKFHFGIDGLETKQVDSEKIHTSLPGLEILGSPEIVNMGPSWIVVEVSNSAEELLDFQPDLVEIKQISSKLSATGICVFTSASKLPRSSDIHLRTFAPFVGVNEDPVCGSGNAAVAFYRDIGSGYTCFQGSAVKRNGIVSISYRDNKIWVGGSCCSVVDGRLTCQVK